MRATHSVYPTDALGNSFECRICRATINRPPDMSDEDWEKEIDGFKEGRRHNQVAQSAL